MNELRAIETTYNGHRFRSRLEARWAVFYDTARVPYEYETEGFDLGGILYLPDFWLPQHSAWVEIKPRPLNELEAKKCALLAKHSRKTVFAFSGQLAAPVDEFGDVPSARMWSGVRFGDGYVEHDEPWCWSVCIDCGPVLVSQSLHCPKCEAATEPSHLLLADAYTAAVQARFEHGERGAHGMTRIGSVVEDFRRGPRIGRAIRLGELLRDAEDRSEGTGAA